MRIWLELPDGVVEQLADKGQDLSRAALEALAIDAYRRERLSGDQIRQLLDIPSLHEFDGFLNRHGVPVEYDVEDFEQEAITSARLWQQRQREQAPDSNRNRSGE